MRPAFFAALLLLAPLAACGDDDSDDGSGSDGGGNADGGDGGSGGDGGGDGGGGDGGGGLPDGGRPDGAPPPDAAPIAESLGAYFQEYCAMSSLCANRDINVCFRELGSFDSAFYFLANQREVLRQRTECLRAAGADCNAFWACIGPGVPEPCDVGSFVERCDGNTAVICGLDGEAPEDCGATGQQCLLEGGQAYCGWPGGCAERIACDGDDRALWCVGTPGMERRFALRCDWSGKVCEGGYCVDAGRTPCTENRCDGSQMLRCSDGFVESWDCNDMVPGLICTNSGSEISGLDCQSATRECEPGQAWCDGDLATVCVKGKPITMDCGRYGATCANLNPRNVGCRIPR